MFLIVLAVKVTLAAPAYLIQIFFCWTCCFIFPKTPPIDMSTCFSYVDETIVVL